MASVTPLEKLLSILKKHNVIPLFESGYVTEHLDSNSTSVGLASENLDHSIAELNIMLQVMESKFKSQNKETLTNIFIHLPLFMNEDFANNWHNECKKYYSNITETEKDRYNTQITPKNGKINPSNFTYIDGGRNNLIWKEYLLFLEDSELIALLKKSKEVFLDIKKEKEIIKNNVTLKNISFISKNLALSKDQEKAWYNWINLCSSQKGLYILHKNLNFFNYWENNVEAMNYILDSALDVPLGTFESIINGKNKISDAGLGYSEVAHDQHDFEHCSTGRSLAEEFVSDSVVRKLVRKYTNTKALLEQFIHVASSPNSNIKKDSFQHIEYDINAIIKSISSPSPIKILLWGNPGSGKTQLAKLCIKEVNNLCVEPPEVEEYASTDKQVDIGQSRLADIKTAIKMSKSLGNPILLVDECEVILTGNENKIGLTTFLEQKDIHQIWVANNLAGMHEAYIRRFDIVIHIPDMPLIYREKLALSLFVKNDISQKVAQSMRTPAEIISAHNWCKQINSYTWDDIIHKISGYQKAITTAKNEKTDKDVIQVIPPSLNKEVGINCIAGYDYVKKEARKIINIFEHPEQYKKVGAKIPKGIMLTGQPGTGKTLFARSIANEIGVPLIMTSASSLAEKPEKIGLLFNEARKHTPCIIFIDEIDVIASDVVDNSGKVSLENQKILNRLLIELDGFESLTDVMIIGATHRAHLLDKAVLRSGRLSKIINFRSPNEVDRIEIFKHYTHDKPLHKNISYNQIGISSRGMSCADMSEIVTVAAQKAAENNQSVITQENFIWASDYVFWGGDEEYKVSKKQSKSTAIHEAGHAVVATLLGKHVERITIKPQSSSLGATNIQEDELNISKTFDMYLDECSILLAGIVAEKEFNGVYQNGGSSDLKRAHHLIRTAIMTLGFGENGTFYSSGKQENSELILEKLDQEENKIIQSQYQKTVKLIKKHKKHIKKLAEKLVTHKEISNVQLCKILKNIVP